LLRHGEKQEDSQSAGIKVSSLNVDIRDTLSSMAWTIEHFERDDGEEPAESFEDALDTSGNRDETRIGGKLIRVAELLA
jgi:hypothetical protein